MNLSLVDPFALAQDYPDTLTGKLRSGHAACLRFSHKGDYLAAGRVDGTVIVFDLETNGVARKLRGHTRQIQSLSESLGYIMTVLVLDADFRSLLFVASLFEEQPVLVDISNPKPIKHILPSVPLRPQDGVDPAAAAKQAAQDAKQSTCVTIFTALGNHIISGTSKGWINIIETQTCKTIHSTRLCNGVIILIRLASNGRDLLINSSDRVIRTVIMSDLSQLGIGLDPSNIKLDVEHKFQDVVNRLSWNHVAFSSTGEFIMASTYMNSDIYIWERSHGSLVKILEGPREEMGVVEWHPSRPMIMSCGLESGSIYIWSIITPQKWSALAPDFAEVEENVVYVEREDEYDIHPAEEVHQQRLDQEDETPDVLSLDHLGSGAAMGELDMDTFRMPVLLDLSDSESEEEIIAVGPGTMRRRSPGAGREWMNTSHDGASSTRGAAANGSSRGPHGRGRKK
ncbi:WD repeat protein [Talaromyces stipitatus ATCC 10500]|uniref:WD repeat protein n=1 Tax=Talaromyces stipitatus (strain ATCC 10500 / CBS 375.48 / QM 6759 / NRRL 1006) TaxID=441959 RepID=B8M2Y3_TALSN|nr:WD repeat protein [Talaromyces stipitatus ATCC 10500]EED22238.1 WD repeat protein [Talaromyces stipitatus ATCC 10500]